MFFACTPTLLLPMLDSILAWATATAGNTQPYFTNSAVNPESVSFISSTVFSIVTVSLTTEIISVLKSNIDVNNKITFSDKEAINSFL